MSSPIIHNETDFAVAPMPDKVHFPRASASVIVKGTFRLVPDGVAEPLEGASQFRGDEFLDDDINAALLYPADLAPYKSRTDVIVLGTFYAPQGEPVTASFVRVIVGTSFAKQVAVLGERDVRSGLFSSKLGEPKPFTELKLGWNEAYGGPAMPDNPSGKGNGNDLAPRVEWSHRVIRRLGERMEPAGLGPINRLWPLRMRKMGTTKRKWLDERAPYHPEDFDWSYHNAAPADQQLDLPLNGDEVVECVNLHPEHATFTSRLPGTRVRAFMHHVDGAGEAVKEEVELMLDTCILDMDAQTVSLVWRGVVDVDEEALASVREILVVEEKLAEEPKPAAPYLARFGEASGEAPEDEAEAESAGEEGDAEPRDSDDVAAAGEEHADAAEDAYDVDEPDALDEEVPEADDAAPAVAGALSGAALASLFSDMTSTMGADISPEMQEALQQAEEMFEQSQQALDDALDTMDKVTDADFEAPNLDDLPTDVDVLDEAEAAVEKLQEYAEKYDIELPPEALEALEDIKADPELAELAERAADDGTPLGLSLAAPAEDAEDAEGEAAAAAADEPPAAPPDEAEVRAMLDAPAPPKAPAGKAAAPGGLAGLSLAGAMLVGAKFPKGRFAGAKLQGGTLSEASLAEADFRGADLSNCDFTGADLTGADFTGAKLDGAQFFEAKLDGAIFNECHGHAVIFVSAHAKEQPPSFTKAVLPEADFQEVEMPGASFRGATLTEASFTDAQLPGATFAEADITALRAAGAELSEASFVDAKGPNAVFVGTTLDKADFEGALLERASCNEASLVEARLFGGRFPNATFSGANLQHANAMNANLMYATLDTADVRYTSFAASNCYGADFGKALIAETDFRETNLDKTVLSNKSLTP